LKKGKITFLKEWQYAYNYAEEYYQFKVKDPPK